ncbi:hypothetical protein Zmor_022484 [Zophobas morio]|uniref:SPEF2 C-terminal domain-containing protein n=1 Tax=Zophobas morio TaxID=2755281 RepID=A0AA38M5F6_9CUCU|nr:hypothetical protein Zmor_022484 [Zophobas morio]
MTGYSNETLEQDDETPSSSKSTLSGPLTKKSSVKYSVFSGVTVLTDYDLTPQDKVTQLLPDLKDIVYSSEEEGEEETVQAEKKICTCVCNPVKPKPQPRASDARRQTQDTLGAINEEEIGDASEHAVGDSEIKVNIQEQGLPQSLREECLCYVLNVQPEDPLATKEEITQTDILGLQQDLGDEPLQRPLAEDVYEEWRLSKIFPNPRPLEKEKYFTVLTAFIKITQKSEDDDEEYVIPCFKDFERKDGLEKFYCDQGCYYSLEYEEFTPDTVKCLAKMFVGDYTLPAKTSVEIFGEDYKQAMLEDGDHKITMKTKKEKKGKKGKKKAKPSKSGTKQSKEKGSKKGKGGKGKESKSKGSKGKKSKDKGSKSSKSSKTKVGEEEAIGHEDKEVQVITIEEVEEEELPEPRAGEPDWEYINLPIPADVELTLANLWDNFEQNYVQNFKELFYKKRILMTSIVPFLAKTRETLTEVIAREDPKQYYLREFQKTLNQIDLSLRNDPKTKEELYCRIDEFRDKLLGICDTKMTETEEERRNFVRQNWLFRQFCDMEENLTVAFQLEIDRLVDTLQFLSDYYTAVITKSLKQGYEFHKELLPRCDCNDDSKSETFNNLFINMESENNEETEFHQNIDDNKNIALVFVESMRPLSVKPIAAMKKLFEAKGKGKKEKKPKKGKKGEGKFELDEDVKENADRIFEEWECALNGEFARLDIHLNVTRNKVFHRFGSVIAWIKKIFLIIFDDTKERYMNEVASVYKACQLLRESIEKEVIIRPELTFENDQLVEIQVTLFPETLVIPEPDYLEGTFKIEQLERIVRILCDLAPNGYIMKKTFMLLIQDILYQDDIEEETDTPKLWRNLTTSTLKALLKKLFDTEVYVYWKDFIVCNLMIPLPTKTELMDIRNQFRQFDPDLSERVTRDDFNSITFSFDDREDVRDRLRSIIFRMYQTDENNLNYTAMLLDFCKDKDPVVGFVKALELSLGKFICNDEEVGKKFVEETLENRMLFEQQLKEHEETRELAKRTISLLIDKIKDQVDGPEGFALEEVETTPNFRYSGILRATIGSQTKSAHSQLSEGKIISERKFSYARIGFEAADNTQLCYFLPLYLVQIIVEATVGWNSKVEFLPSPSFKDRVVEIYEECRNEQFHNVVLAHQFLNNEKLRELLQSTNKFLAHNPVRIVKHILEDPPEEEEEVSGQSFGSGTNVEKQSEL